MISKQSMTAGSSLHALTLNGSQVKELNCCHKAKTLGLPNAGMDYGETEDPTTCAREHLPFLGVEML